MLFCSTYYPEYTKVKEKFEAHPAIGVLKNYIFDIWINNDLSKFNLNSNSS